MERLYYCMNCQTSISENDKVCCVCGYRLQRVPPIEPRWSFTWDKNPCVDEHYGGRGVYGLFTATGWCVVGVSLRLRCRARVIGVILFNHFVGWWWDENPEEWTRETL